LRADGIGCSQEGEWGEEFEKHGGG
jgi:hypothetical protein